MKDLKKSEKQALYEQITKNPPYFDIQAFEEKPISDFCKHFICSCLAKDYKQRSTADYLLSHNWLDDE